MGICECKSLAKVMITSELNVPDRANPMTNLNAHLGKNVKMKTFLKLHGGNEIVGDASTEKLITTKAIKGNLFTQQNIDCNDLPSSPKKLTYSKRNELLRKITEKNSHSSNNSPKRLCKLKRQDFEYSYSNKEITPEDEANFLLLFHSHFLFRNFDEVMLKNLLDELNGYQVEVGSVIYNEGDEGSCLFLIKKGQVEIFVKGKPSKILCECDCFGELALMHENSKRTATARAATQVELLVLEGYTYREINKDINRNTILQVLHFIQGISLLTHLDQIIKMNIAMQTFLQEFEKGEKIISHKISSLKENTEKIYIVSKGALCYISKTGFTKTLYPKEYFGEKKVILNLPESNDFEVISVEKTSCYVISKSILEEAISSNYQEIILFSIFREALRRNKYFKTLFMESHYESLFKSFALKVYSADAVIFESSARTNKKAVLVLTGCLVDSSKTEILADIGCLYGDEIIRSNENLLTEIIASGECVTLEAKWEDILSSLKNIMTATSNLDVFKRVNKLSRMPIFKHLPEAKLMELCNIMNKEKFHPGHYIFLENTPEDTFYLISKGKVKILHGYKIIGELEEGSSFGELSLFSELHRTISVVAATDVTCLSLSKEAFLKFLSDKNMNEYIRNKVCMEDTGISLDDLYYISFLGRGRDATVSLVHNGVCTYAIKTIERSLVDRQRSLAKYLISEKQTLLCLDHPFIVKLVKTMKNDNFCFFLFEYVKGKTLEECLALKKQKRNIQETKFYGASLLLILDYLHKKMVIHRDINPSNIMIDTTGYIRLIDFEAATKIKDFAYTVIGTPQYMAPEILLGRGYSSTCDYWSVGICMYYIYYGIFPFGAYEGDLMEIYDEIIKKELSFPPTNPNHELNNFLAGLINKNPTKRLGSLRNIKLHSLFKDFQWNELIELKINTPFQPKDERESSNLKNVSRPFKVVVENEKFEKNSHPQLPFATEVQDQTPRDYNSKWIDEF